MGEKVNLLEDFRLKEANSMARNWKLYAVFLSFILILFREYCTAKDTLTQSQKLSVNQSLVSAREIFELGFFSPGNSRNLYIGIWYKNIPVRRILWVGNRENPVLANDSASSFKIGSDGNIKLVDGKQRIVWSTNVSIQSNSKTSAVLTDKGELILKDTGLGVILWNSFGFPCDTIIPGMNLGYDIRAGEKQELSSWKSEDDPSPGNFKVGLSQETPPQAFTWVNNSKPYWRSGPWNGGKFIGISSQDSGYSKGMNLVQDNNQGTAYFSYNMFNRSYVAITSITPSGTFRISEWNAKMNKWEVNWEAPDHLCDVYGTCGPFSVCDKKKPPFCDCLRGFIPKSSEEWSKGNWTSGCVRRNELLCELYTSSMAAEESKKDTFLKLTETKLPHHFVYLYDQDDDAGCREWCFKNCSCVAYAFPHGIGCMVWTSGLIDVLQFSFAGEDLYLRLAGSEFGEDKRRIGLIAGLTIVTSAVLLGIFIYMIFMWRSNRKEKGKSAGGRRKRIKDMFLVGEAQNKRDITGEELPCDSSELPMIGFDELAAATNDFSNDNKLGAGGFGVVYKGILVNGQEIAVKRLSAHSGQGVEEFKNEILIISKLRHRNLVRLLGCSVHGDEKLLVYELMKNKSLDNFLFDQTKKVELDWAKRFNIIQGIARGLLYLHRDSCLRIIHRDLKASNILLDTDMNPKISDFGLARTIIVTEEIYTHRIMGTFGYMSPEYVIGGQFSEKSDVYSFGVLLLEIVSGRRNCGFYNHEKHFSLLSYAWQLWSESREVDLIDESITNTCSLTEALRCIRIGLLCVQDHVSDRPTMSNVVLMLCSETEIPRPKQPTFTIQSLLESADSKPHFSRNEITVSITEAR